jgi:hypothetical protein
MIRGIAISNIGARYSHVLVGGMNNENLRKWVPETDPSWAYFFLFFDCLNRRRAVLFTEMDFSSCCPSVTAIPHQML